MSAIEATTQPLRVVIAGGGTGGHLYPGIAIAEAFQSNVPGSEIHFIGATNGIEARVLPAEGWNVDLIEASRLRGGGLWIMLKGLWRLPFGILRCVRILRRLRPAIVVGVGGYASGAAMVAAVLCRIPRVVQEQNAIPGMTNRILGRIANRTYVSFPEAICHFPNGQAVLVGNPIRAAIREALSEATPARSDVNAPLHVLVVGGSQGSRFLNEQVPDVLKRVRDGGVEVEVLHQTGAADEEITRARYEERGLKVDVRSYVRKMADAYSWADLAICRAGASTIAELTAVGVPAFFVPFPYAAYDHQTANAKAVSQAGGARVFQQSDWNVAEVSETLINLARTRSSLAEMGDRSRDLGRPNAAQSIVGDTLMLLGIEQESGGRE